MCEKCDKARAAWYEAFKARSPYAEQFKALYQATLRLCREYQQQREWARSGPPNPPMTEELEEATR